MTVRCPDCKLVYAYIAEPDGDTKLLYRDVKCKCGKEYKIAYKQGSRHQFNQDAIPAGMDSNVNLMR